MRWIITIAGMTAISLAGWQLQEDPDPIVQSFERELNHEPVASAPVRRDSINHDELYRIINSVHWTEEAQTATESTDSVLRSTEADEDIED